MKSGLWWKIAIVAALVVAIVVVEKAKDWRSASTDTPSDPAATQPASAEKLPRLLELGSTECVPCKMMEPVLEELRAEYAGKLRVDFIDIQENPDAAKKYGIRSIPTQIFFDASGKEIFRHQGFFAKDDIVVKFNELNIDL